MHETTQAIPGGSKGRRFRFGIFRFSSVELLISIALLILISPFVEGLPRGDVIEGALLSLVILAAVMAVGARRRTFIIAGLLAVPTVGGKWLNHIQPEMFPGEIFLASAMIFLGFVIVNILRFVLKTPRVNTEVLCASVSAYLLLGVLWAMAFRLVVVIKPSSFSFNIAQAANGSMDGFTSFYFSFVTLTTLGYGDITPVSNVARMLSVMESMTGTLYVAVLIARLVGLYSAQGPPNPTDSSDPSQP